MSRAEGVIWCDNCGAEITWGPLVKVVAMPGKDVPQEHFPKGKDPPVGRLNVRDYCCQDCYEGRSCHCGERMDMEDERRGKGAEQTPGAMNYG